MRSVKRHYLSLCSNAKRKEGLFTCSCAFIVHTSVMKVCVCRALRSGFQLIPEKKNGPNDGLFSNFLIDLIAVKLFRQQNLSELIELQRLFNLGNLGNTKVICEPAREQLCNLILH